MKVSTGKKKQAKSLAAVLAGVETDMAAAVAEIVAHRRVEKPVRRRRRAPATDTAHAA